MVNTEFYWNPTGDIQSVEFTEQTQCRYVELYSYPMLVTTGRIEGSLDDNSLEQWFEKVLNAFITYI